ncbi:MAG: DUF1385 domain-containing protein [Nitrospiraceae bacterium]|nr:MAG: DUF1385 domain-containing protein [Nitrospiraceae bacterium]
MDKKDRMKDIGGQAVIEGVMMRAGDIWTVAVRNPEKEIVIRKEGVKALPKSLKKPVVRGVVALAQSLSLGIKALLFSAEASGHEEEKPSSFSLAMTVIVAFVIGICLFLLLPLYVTKLMGMVFSSVNDSSLLFNFIDGILRVMVFLFYILAINMSKDIKRVFQYHGAEHKAVNAYEAGVELTPENVDNYSTLHPRCGTSFLLIVMLMSILIFSIIPKAWPFVWKFLARVVLIPLIAGLSYEFIKLSSKKMDNLFIRMAAVPGLWLQKLTTGLPSHDQIEVAITALKGVLQEESDKKELKESSGNVVA